MVVKDGRFGPYVTDGESNATLRKGDDVEAITLERAAELLAERRAAGPATRRRPPRRPRQEGRGEEGTGEEDGREEGRREAPVTAG